VSFVINPAERAVGERASERLNRAFMAQLERSNSARLIAQARQIYWHYLHRGGGCSPAPKGVVLQGGGGRVVFNLPTLLPSELFVPGDWLLGQGGGNSRSLRSRPRAQSAC
jgi:hypothetical protein